MTQNNICRIVCLLFISRLFSFDYNLSLESKYGQGIQILGYDSNDPIIDSTYKYNEHILDLNLNFDSGLYINTQFEYSKPPVFGKELMGLNSFYLEYELDKFKFKFGDIYTLYGRGLSVNMFQDQVIDYNNSIRGLEFNYYLNDDIALFGIAGVSDFKFRTLPSERETDLGLSNKAFVGGIEFRDFHYLYLYQESIIDYDRYSFSNYALIDNLGLNSGKDTLYTGEHNFSISLNFFETDIYIEDSQSKYNTANGKDLCGSKLYGSIYRDIFGFGLTYEYKNYFMYDYIPTLSNPPIVYRESNSSLAARNSHVIDWSDEIGHQLDINRYFNDKFSLEMNLSVAYKHKKGTDFFDGINSVKFSKNIYSRSPFRQFYIAMSGWLVNNKLYYKIGYDSFDELRDKVFQYNHINAITFPTLFTYTLGEHSITAYIEKQTKSDKYFMIANHSLVSILKEYEDRYLSLTFNYKGKASLSYFFEDEYYSWKNVKDNEYSKWQGIDVSFNMNSTTQLSLFYGSQKGGLVCANGVCADQPGFDDGMKLTLRSLF